MKSTEITLNGRRVAIAGEDPAESLLRWLNRHRWTGTKEGCADGDCGACTVAIVDTTGAAPRWRAVNSCLVPMGVMPGREVLTVEALADGDTLHPVQQAMVDTAGSQCGYCTPGFVMSLFAGWCHGELGDDAIEGNLCRCTGYAPIRHAAERLKSVAANDRFVAGPREPHAPLASASLDRFHNPATIEEALALRAAHPEAHWLAGGTDVGVELSHGRGTERAFIALDRIAALRGIAVGAESVRIGAGVPLTLVERELAGIFPALDDMLPWFAARQVRNRATFGGNLGTASPIGDLSPVLLALEATVELRGPRGTRTVPIEKFFTSYRTTLRTPDELIVAVEIPRRPELVQGSYKVAKRQTDDISIVAGSFAIALGDRRTVKQARLAYGGVAATPLRATRTEALLLDQRLTPELVDAARVALEGEFTPLDDHRSGADYRRRLAGNLFAKFVAERCA
ncbi:MAG TPA: FAD binding domain-containing protein [Xanthomonadales bacterium]|nr:FAD binding domain-containing protein [Xanthomonadales bacterium]